MFGNFAAFLNGNMFMGIYGDQLFVRLPEEKRKELLSIAGTALFEPMKGRAMKEYVVFPESWKKDPKSAQKWISKSVAWVEQLPQKTKKQKA